jgi:hypothetical protein
LKIMDFLETLLKFNPRSPPKTHQTPEKNNCHEPTQER